MITEERKVWDNNLPGKAIAYYDEDGVCEFGICVEVDKSGLLLKVATHNGCKGIKYDYIHVLDVEKQKVSLMCVPIMGV